MKFFEKTLSILKETAKKRELTEWEKKIGRMAATRMGRAIHMQALLSTAEAYKAEMDFYMNGAWACDAADAKVQIGIDKLYALEAAGYGEIRRCRIGSIHC